MVLDANILVRLVTRVSKGEWVISTDGTNALAVYSTQVKRRATFTSEYVLPFQIDVVCSRCNSVN